MVEDAGTLEKVTEMVTEVMAHRRSYQEKVKGIVRSEKVTSIGHLERVRVEVALSSWVKEEKVAGHSHVEIREGVEDHSS